MITQPKTTLFKINRFKINPFKGTFKSTLLKIRTEGLTRSEV